MERSLEVGLIGVALGTGCIESRRDRRMQLDASHNSLNKVWIGNGGNAEGYAARPGIGDDLIGCPCMNY